MATPQERLNQQGIFLTKEGLARCIDEVGNKNDLEKYILEVTLHHTCVTLIGFYRRI